MWRWFDGDARSVRRNEVVLLYPSYAAERAEGAGWRALVHGCVFDPRVSWLRRKAVEGVFKTALRHEPDSKAYLHARLERFLVNFASERAMSVRIRRRTANVATTDLRGLFSGTIEFTPAEWDDWRQSRADDGWLPISAVLPSGDERQFQGWVQPISSTGPSIISDIDDTIKHSDVPNRRELFHNTFGRLFRPIAGMAELYRRCESHGAAFHYVSGSPWQLFEPLQEFWQRGGFPRGSFHLKPFRLRDSARKLRMSPQVSHKRSSILPILAAFPRRNFFLIGDSGEQDPEIYAKLAVEHPRQIAGVFIRAAKQERPDAHRFQTAFAGLPRERWLVYQSVDELQQTLLPRVAALQETR